MLAQRDSRGREQTIKKIKNKKAQTSAVASCWLPEPGLTSEGRPFLVAP